MPFTGTIRDKALYEQYSLKTSHLWGFFCKNIKNPPCANRREMDIPELIYRKNNHIISALVVNCKYQGIFIPFFKKG